MHADLPDDAPAAIETLVERCVHGDQAVWAAIVGLYWRKVFHVAYKFVGRHDAAEDLAQDIFLKVFKSLDTLESLFLNTVKYENDRLEAYMKRLSKQ